MLVDSTEASNNTPQQIDYLLKWKICAAVQTCQIQTKTAAVTFENILKVKLLIGYEGLGKENYLWYWKTMLFIKAIKG